MPLHFPSRPDQDLAAASVSGSEVVLESRGGEAGPPEEQEVDVASRSQEEEELRQTVELPSRYQYPPKHAGSGHEVRPY